MALTSSHSFIIPIIEILSHSNVEPLINNLLWHLWHGFYDGFSLTGFQPARPTLKSVQKCLYADLLLLAKYKLVCKHSTNILENSVFPVVAVTKRLLGSAPTSFKLQVDEDAHSWIVLLWLWRQCTMLRNCYNYFLWYVCLLGQR